MTIFRAEVLRCLKKNDMEKLKELINQGDIAKINHIFKQLSVSERGKIIRLIKKDRARYIYGNLDNEMREELLQYLYPKLEPVACEKRQYFFKNLRTNTIKGFKFLQLFAIAIF